jgi:hypothetical protein
MPDQSVYIFVAMYPSPADAQVDYVAVKELYGSGKIAAYDAAVVYRDDKSLIQVTQDEKSGRHEAWTGVAVNALLGVIHPVAQLWQAAAGAEAPGLADYFSRGLPREELVLLGEMLESHLAALVVVAPSPVEAALQQLGSHAIRQYERELTTDSRHFQKDFDEAIVQIVANEP